MADDIKILLLSGISGRAMDRIGKKSSLKAKFKGRVLFLSRVLVLMLVPTQKGKTPEGLELEPLFQKGKPQHPKPGRKA